MYERSAIVLENYFSRIFGLNKVKNLRTNYEDYAQMIDEIKEYQRVIQEEENVIQKFDEAAAEIEEIQRRQHKLHDENLEIENQRDQIFNDLSENPSILDQKLQKLENKLEDNNIELKEIREKYVKSLVIFTERQKERNKYARIHRTTEGEYLNNAKLAVKNFDEIDENDIQQIRKFQTEDKKRYIQEITNIMLRNGKNERIPFDNLAIENAVNARMEIAQEEAGLYISIYERMKKLLIELNSGNIKLAKSEKVLRDASVKFDFLNAKKEYIVSFLDNERITAMNGKIIHESLMKEACQNFQVDIKQINNLYELVARETVGKATKKAYKELYNKTYLKDIQEKERDFEEEVTNIKINMGTVINSNYWRIEGIKNIYNTFQEEISEKFNKDLSEYRVEDINEENENNILFTTNNEEQITNNNEEVEEDNIENYIKLDKPNRNIKNEDKKIDEDEYDDYYDDDYDEDSDYDEYYEDDDYDDYDDEDEYDDDYDDEYEDDDEYNDDIELQFDDDYEDEYDDEDTEEDDEITEEKLDNMIRKSRKNKKNTNKKEEKGLFGKLFRK
mgnify:FL=1